MRLVTFRGDDRTDAGVLTDHGVALIGSVTGAGYADVGALLEAGERGLDDARAALSEGPFLDWEPEQLMRPILAPGGVVCVGLNYRTHIMEMGRDLPSNPTYFSKLARALTDPYAEIELPRSSAKVDYEGELAVVVGKGGRCIALEDAWSAVAGLTLMNDVTARDFQQRTRQWFAGKTWERSTPVGPAVVSIDEISAVEDLDLVVRVNDEVRQRASIGDLVFGVPALIEDLSRIVALRPGDLIATGTPGGVGDALNPPRYLSDSDVVEVEVDGIGLLRNRFRASG